MGEPKAFASLSSGLLARKGAARPAMRPQGFGQIGGQGLEDLGWNDMGFEPPKPAVVPIRDADHDAFGEEVGEPALRNPVAALTPASPVHDQQAEIAERFAAHDEDGEDEDGDYIDETAELADEEVAAKPVAFAAPIKQPVRIVRPRAAPGSKGKAAFTLRLEPDRHLKLRLACALDGRSAQQIVTAALDEYLANKPELDAMAEQSPRSRKGA
jgi:hypothetical protein